jgi:hypothetical protein
MAATPEAVMLDLAYSFAKGKVLYTAVVTKIPYAFAEKGKSAIFFMAAKLTATSCSPIEQIWTTINVQ